MENKKSGIATASLVLGIVGICLSFIPIVNNASFILGIVGIILGIVSIIKKSGKSKAIVGVILSILAIVITVSLQNIWVNSINDSIDEFNENMNDLSGDNTEKILKNDVDVNIGQFEVSTDEWGLIDSKLTVTITNKSKKTTSYSIKIEAINSEGNRIDEDTIYVDSLGSNQSKTETTFTLVDSDQVEQLKTATFKVVEVSKY